MSCPAQHAPLRCGHTVIVKLERHTDNVIALFFEQRRRDGTVDPARHGDDNARFAGWFIEAEGVHKISPVLPPKSQAVSANGDGGQYLRPHATFLQNNSLVKAEAVHNGHFFCRRRAPN